MLFKKKRLVVIAIVLLALVVMVGVLFSRRNQPNDACTPKDREQNNCVPAGRCTPPGDPQESKIDCLLKNYDHKFNLGE
jgi:hypothetical protein